MSDSASGRKPRTASRKAADDLASLMLFGLILTFAGWALVVVGWPSTEALGGSELIDDIEVEQGNKPMFFVGLGLASLASLLVSISVIGYGVMIGMRAARSDGAE